VELAALPEQIRGFGPIRARHVSHYLARRQELLAQWDGGGNRGAAADTTVMDSRASVVMAG
jgi:indolepyruvate ferredoxin oxidoreductase